MENIKNSNSLDELVTYMRQKLGCTAVLVTRITTTEQLIVANAGLPLPAQFAKSTPLEYSICQHTVAMDFPLVVEDANAHPLLRGNLAVSQFGLGSYLGVPVHLGPDDIASLCAIERHQRQWTQDEIEFILLAGERAGVLFHVA